MNGIEEEVEDKKDLSRPYFPRKAGEVGLYVDVEDMVCQDAHAYGSEQLMRIEMQEKLGQQLTRRDLVPVKGQLHSRGLFQGVVLEEFRRGSILAVIFDSLSSLQDLNKLHEGKQLSSIFQSIFVDKAMLKALAVKKLTLRVRVWPDEVEACREEMIKMENDNTRMNIKSRPRDVALLHLVRKFQKDQSSQLLQLHDAEAEFDRHLSEFLMVVKRALPQKTLKLTNLKEFQTNMTVAMGTSAKDMHYVKHYLSTLELIRNLLTQVEANIYVPLTLIPARCETDKQQELKKQMKATCALMQRLLKTTTNLKEAYYKEWESKILPRERTLFMGLISLIPLGVEKVTDVDQFFDEYVTGFPSGI